VTLLSGCTALPITNDSNNDKETPTADHTADDIIINNKRNEVVNVQLVFDSENDSEPDFELTIFIQANDVVTWAENKLLNSAGNVKASLQGVSGEKQSDTVFWEGDTPNDSHQLNVNVDTDGISVLASVI